MIKKVLLTIACVLVVLAVVAYFTNPSKDAHIEALIEERTAGLDDNAYKLLDAKALMKKELDKTFQYDSYGVCSKGRVAGEDVTLGAFCKVFVK